MGVGPWCLGFRLLMRTKQYAHIRADAGAVASVGGRAGEEQLWRFRSRRADVDRVHGEIVGLSDEGWSGGHKGCREHWSGRLGGVGGFGWGRSCVSWVGRSRGWFEVDRGACARGAHV